MAPPFPGTPLASLPASHLTMHRQCFLPFSTCNGSVQLPPAPSLGCGARPWPATAAVAAVARSAPLSASAAPAAADAAAHVCCHDRAAVAISLVIPYQTAVHALLMQLRMRPLPGLSTRWFGVK
eukprot:351012-Chlamydomonas_euryale.AAC.3